MNPLVLLAIGLGVVLASILRLRLHAFLALMFGAFVVGGLTSQANLRLAMQSKYHGEAVRSAIQEELTRRAEVLDERGQEFDVSQQREMVRREIKLQSAEIEAAAAAKAEAFAESNSTITRLTQAMGETFQKIGLLIALACVIGRCLLASGAAERIVRGMFQLFGVRGVPFAFSASSFLLSIPVFFDSVFLLVIPLAKATWLKLRKNYLLFTLALVTGGTMTHSLVPPTPGPLFVAEELGVNIGTMILVGMAVGLCCTAVGLAYAYWLNKWMDIPVRDSPAAIEQLDKLSQRPLHELPSLWFSLMPVLLPVVLISGATIYASRLGPTQSLPAVLGFLGDKNIALGLASVLAMILASIQLRDRKNFAAQIQLAMQEASLIILVCCAGGAFGAALQQSGIGPFISKLSGSEPLDFALLPLAFFLTATIRSAQGSSTVAMLTAVEIVTSLAPNPGDLSYHPVYLAVSIGCGSKPIPWMNDSGFWVISRVSGLTEQEMLKTHTPMVTFMGLTGILVTMAAAKIFPLLG